MGGLQSLHGWVGCNLYKDVCLERPNAKRTKVTRCERQFDEDKRQHRGFRNVNKRQHRELQNRDTYEKIHAFLKKEDEDEVQTGDETRPLLVSPDDYDFRRDVKANNMGTGGEIEGIPAVCFTLYTYIAENE